MKEVATVSNSPSVQSLPIRPFHSIYFSLLVIESSRGSRFISTLRSVLQPETFQFPPGEPWGAPRSGGIYNPSSKSLAFTSTAAFKEGQPGGELIRHSGHMHRLLPIAPGAAALLQSPCRGTTYSPFHLPTAESNPDLFRKNTNISVFFFSWSWDR